MTERLQDWSMPRICTRDRSIIKLAIPSCLVRAWRDCLFVSMVIIVPMSFSETTSFVVRSADTLRVGTQPFYFLGANAYYLLEQAARQDTATVKALFATANSLRMTVVRTWGFFDSSDSLNPAVIQYRPGVFNEDGLRALDFVVYQAKLHNVRLLIPLVNSWDDYGGMNQYARWRSQTTASGSLRERFSPSDQTNVINGGNGRSYRFATNALFGHDDFYSDVTIKSWFKNYIATIINRMNVFTGIRYRDEPMILGWELANEPRSSDRSTRLIHTWASEIASYIKSIDQNHLVGTGEEGFDASPGTYSSNLYNNQHWLFDGSAGVSFASNSSIPSIDFGSCHLYPESWGLGSSAGNAWIRDHIRIARGLRKPLIVGEFGVTQSKEATYESWLTTALLDGAAGAIVWQILEGQRTDWQGFGVRCSTEGQLCARFSVSGARFSFKSQNGPLPVPTGFSLHQNYPNPFNGVTTILYLLPADAYVDLSVFDIVGRNVATIVDGVQSAGERRELVDAQALASGPYIYRLVVAHPLEPLNRRYEQSRKMLLLR